MFNKEYLFRWLVLLDCIDLYILFVFGKKFYNNINL